MSSEFTLTTEMSTNSLNRNSVNVPDEIWLRIFVCVTARDINTLLNVRTSCRRFYQLCNENSIWYTAYCSRYPVWSRHVEFTDKNPSEWRKLLEWEIEFENYWRRSSRLSALEQQSDIEDNNNNVLIDEDIDVDNNGSNENSDNQQVTMSIDNSYKTYLWRLSELSAFDPLIAEAFSLTDTPLDERHNFKFSRFLIADYTSPDQGIVSNGVYLEGQPNSVVRAWSFPEHEIVYEDILRPDDSMHQEHLLEINWWAKLMVTTLTNWDGIWQVLRVYDIATKPKRLLSEFTLEVGLVGRQVYVLPSWYQRQKSLNIQPEVIIAGIERGGAERGIVIRHDITTSRTVTIYLEYNTYVTYVDPCFPEIAITLDKHLYLVVWSTIDGQELIRILPEEGFYFDRIALSNITEHLPNDPFSDLTTHELNKKLQRLRIIVTSVGFGYYNQQHQLGMCDLTLPIRPFTFPSLERATDSISAVTYANGERFVNKANSNDKNLVSLCKVQQHGPYPGRIYYLRAIGHLLFAVNYKAHDGVFKNSLSSYNLNNGEIIYHSDIVTNSHNITQLNRELLVVTNEDLYTLKPATANE